MKHRVPLRELLRSLMRGEEPRSRRRVAPAPTGGLETEVRGVVLALRCEDDGLALEVDGAWNFVHLDLDGFPVGVSVEEGAGWICVEIADTTVAVGDAVVVRTRTTLTDHTTVELHTR